MCLFITNIINIFKKSNTWAYMMKNKLYFEIVLNIYYDENTVEIPKQKKAPQTKTTKKPKQKQTNKQNLTIKN